MADEYNRNANDMSEADLKSNFRKVEAAWQSANKMQEEKVQLATQTYEMVDRHIRRLDSDLSRFESELAERGGLETSSPHSDKKNARNRRGAEGEEEKGAAGGFQIAAQDVLDMPVDPNEPTYCSCHQVSYGEMIGCDNPDVMNFKKFNPWKHWSILVSNRVVPFWLRGFNVETKGQMVLRPMQTGFRIATPEKEEKMTQKKNRKFSKNSRKFFFFALDG